MVVDLPEPLGPRSPNTSPRRISKSTLSTARALGRPQKSLNTLVRPVARTTTSSLECSADALPEGEGGFMRRKRVREQGEEFEEAGVSLKETAVSLGASRSGGLRGGGSGARVGGVVALDEGLEFFALAD